MSLSQPLQLKYACLKNIGDLCYSNESSEDALDAYFEVNEFF